jgi:hypothetical protein
VELRSVLESFSERAGIEDEPERPMPEPQPEPRPEPPPEPRPEPTPPSSPVGHYDELAAEEVISLLGSLEPVDLNALRDYERAHGRRESVIGAIDSVLARSPASHA